MEIRITIPDSSSLENMSRSISLEKESLLRNNADRLPQDCSVVWNRILKHLQMRSTVLTYSAWFSYLEPDYIDYVEKRLVLKTEADFVRQVIRQKYWDLLQDVVTDVLGAGYEAHIVLNCPEQEDA